MRKVVQSSIGLITKKEISNVMVCIDKIIEKTCRGVTEHENFTLEYARKIPGMY